MGAPRLLAALLAAATIAGCTDDLAAPVLPPVTSSGSPSTEPVAPSTMRPPVNPWLEAEVRPNVVAAGDWFEVTPSAEVRSHCGVSLHVYTPIPSGQGELLGAILWGDEWVGHDEGVTTTQLACLPPSDSVAVSARIPEELAAGLHEVCRRDVGNAAGCGLVRVVRPGDLDDVELGAVADPAVVAPGDALTIVPPSTDTRVCSRLELHVLVDGQLDLVGFPNSDGDVNLPVPGATTTVPRCGAAAGIPSEPVTLVTPDLPGGQYVLCLAFRDDRDSCARFEVAT